MTNSPLTLSDRAGQSVCRIQRQWWDTDSPATERDSHGEEAELGDFSAAVSSSVEASELLECSSVAVRVEVDKD